MTVAELIEELQALPDHTLDVVGASGSLIDGVEEKAEDDDDFIQLTEDQD